jgi:thiol-disulfide isomerase/thioredoxin
VIWRTALLMLGAGVLAGAVGLVHAESEGQQLAQAAGRTLIGTPGPRVILTTIDGKSIDLGALYGKKAVYLKFWATWCVPCRQQMPHFEHTYETAGDELAVVAVDAGFNESLEDVRAYQRKMGLKMPIVIDDGRLADALHLRVTPEHIVIGRAGQIEYVGHLVDDQLEAALKAARNEPVPVAATQVRGNPLAAPSGLAVGSRVDLALRTIDGQTLPIADPAHRRATVLVFLSPWCESYLATSRPQRAEACRQAREQTEQLAATAKMRWIGVASGLWATTAELADYRQENRVSIPLALDESGDVFRRFGVRDVPTFIVVSPEGQLEHGTGKLTDLTGPRPASSRGNGA